MHFFMIFMRILLTGVGDHSLWAQGAVRNSSQKLDYVSDTYPGLWWTVYGHDQEPAYVSDLRYHLSRGPALGGTAGPTNNSWADISDIVWQLEQLPRQQDKGCRTSGLGTSPPPRSPITPQIYTFILYGIFREPTLSINTNLWGVFFLWVPTSALKVASGKS